MWAAAEAHGPVVEALIEGGADINLRSNAGTTPFMFAVRKGDMACVNAMLAAGARREREETRSLDAVARRDHQRARGSRGSVARKGSRSERRGWIDRTDGARRASAGTEDPAQDALLSRSASRRRHRGWERSQQQLGQAAAGRRARGQLAHQR